MSPSAKMHIALNLSNPLQKTEEFALKQRGFGLYIVVLLLGAAGLVTIISIITARSLQTREQSEHAKILAAAKSSLVGWAITRGSTLTPGSDRPGDLPTPDTLSETTGNYDGDYESSTCLNASGTNGLPAISTGPNLRCLGRLPWRTLKTNLSIPIERDANNNQKSGEQDIEGKMPWYGVSANLVRTHTCLITLNSETPSLPYTSHACGSSTNLPYPWLTVRDARGNIISNRVAFVILIPGAAINSQSRNPYPNLGRANQYLDNLTVPTGCASPCVPGTYSNSDLDNDFIAGDASDTFNDKLLYVTIDELMVAVENQVANTLSSSIRRFSENYSEIGPSTRRYFWLAPFNPAGSAYQTGVIGNLRGMLPEHPSTSFATAFQWQLTGTVDPDGTVTAAEIRSQSISSSNGTCTWTSDGARGINCSATILNPKAGVDRRLINLSYTGSSSTHTVNTNHTDSDLVITPATASSHITRSVNKTTLSSVTLTIRDQSIICIFFG